MIISRNFCTDIPEPHIKLINQLNAAHTHTQYQFAEIFIKTQASFHWDLFISKKNNAHTHE